MEELAIAAMMQNVDVSAQVVLSLDGSFERNITEYECEEIGTIKVDFINAAPNFLAIVPLGPEKRVFVNVLSADGAKYVSGQFEFWTRGTEATLTDVTVEPATISCAERIDTP